MNEKLAFDNFEIRDIKEDSDGKLWLATEDYGLLTFTIKPDQTLSLLHNYNVENSNIVSNHVRQNFLL